MDGQLSAGCILTAPHKPALLLGGFCPVVGQIVGDTFSDSLEEGFMIKRAPVPLSAMKSAVFARKQKEPHLML